MSEAHAECPSGLIVEVRGLKTREASLLAERQGTRDGSAYNQMLDNCTLRVVEPGPYTLSPEGRLDWSKVHVGDRLFALLRIRSATHGEEYAFRLTCQERDCRQRFDWSLNLCDLPVKVMPDPARESLKTGRDLTATVGGKKLRFRLMRGEDEARQMQIVRQNPGRTLAVALNGRVTEIDGVHKNDKLRHLEDLPLGEANALLALLDEADGGVETEIQVECPHCGAVQDVRLPFGKEFFMPRVARKEAT